MKTLADWRDSVTNVDILNNSVNMLRKVAIGCVLTQTSMLLSIYLYFQNIFPIHSHEGFIFNIVCFLFAWPGVFVRYYKSLCLLLLHSILTYLFCVILNTSGLQVQKRCTTQRVMWHRWLTVQLPWRAHIWVNYLFLLFEIQLMYAFVYSCGKQGETIILICKGSFMGSRKA